MAQLLHSVCFPPSPTSTSTSISLLEPHSFTPSLSLSSPPKPPISFSLSSVRRHSRLYPISSSSSSSSSSTLTIQNPSSSTESTEQQQQQEVSATRLLAQNIPWSSTADDIRALFQNYGTVDDVELSMHNKTRNRGLAFVEMSSVEEAALAHAKLESYEYEGRILKLSYATPKKKITYAPVQSKPAVVYNLFVSNLAFTARARDLKELFQSGGSEVISAQVIFHENPRRPSGYGFVSFKTKKEADEALTAFEGKELMGRSIRVARSNRFVKLESEINTQSEDGDDLANDSGHDSEQTETADNL